MFKRRKIFKKNLFIHERQRRGGGRDTGGERSRLHARSPMWDLSWIPGSRLELKVDAPPLSHPGIPRRKILKELLLSDSNKKRNSHEKRMTKMVLCISLELFECDRNVIGVIILFTRC